MPSGFSPQRAIREPQGVPNKRVVRAVSLISSLGLGSRKREALQRGFLSLVLICEMIEETRSRWTVPSFLLPRNTEAPWAWQTFRKKRPGLGWPYLSRTVAASQNCAKFYSKFGGTRITNAISRNLGASCEMRANCSIARKFSLAMPALISSRSRARSDFSSSK